jgi:CelD/BcsL family acetyltransferase involved in cellulose biosynthesis
VAYNEKFQQYCPGHLIVNEILRDCASRGVSQYDITGPDDDWKIKWTSETRSMCKYFIFRKGIPGCLAYTLKFRVRPTIKKYFRKK